MDYRGFSFQVKEKNNAWELTHYVQPEVLTFKSAMLKIFKVRFNNTTPIDKNYTVIVLIYRVYILLTSRNIKAPNLVL